MKKFLAHSKRYAFAFLALLGLCLPVMAAGEGDVPGLSDIQTKLTAWVTSVTGSITTWFTTNWDNLLVVLGIALGIVVVWTVYKFITKGVKKVG